MINDMTFEDVRKLLDLSPNATCGYVRVTFVSKHKIAPGGMQAPFADGRPDASVPRPIGWLALCLLPIGIGLLVTGTFVTAAGPHSGGADIRRLGDLEDALYVHVRLSAAFGIGFLILLGALVLHRRTAHGELLLGCAALVLLLVQMGIGEYQWRNELPWAVVLVHVTLAAAIWATLVALTVRLVWASGLSRRATAQTGVVPAVPGGPAGR